MVPPFEIGFQMLNQMDYFKSTSRDFATVLRGEAGNRDVAGTFSGAGQAGRLPRQAGVVYVCWFSYQGAFSRSFARMACER